MDIFIHRSCFSFLRGFRAIEISQQKRPSRTILGCGFRSNVESRNIARKNLRWDAVVNKIRFSAGFSIISRLLRDFGHCVKSELIETARHDLRRTRISFRSESGPPCGTDAICRHDGYILTRTSRNRDWNTTRRVPPPSSSYLLLSRLPVTRNLRRYSRQARPLPLLYSTLTLSRCVALRRVTRCAAFTSTDLGNAK